MIFPKLAKAFLILAIVFLGSIATCAPDGHQHQQLAR